MKPEQHTSIPLPIHPAFQAPPVVCQMLRSRGGVDDHFDNIDWRHGHSSTATYWCLATMETVGPDDHYAHAQLCRDGRSCFRKPVE
jgi:hypothetical protein